MCVDDWFIIIVAYVSKNLSVIRESLSPLFLNIGMENLRGHAEMGNDNEYLFEPKVCQATLLHIEL
jgi:hypothetical protein